MKRNDTGILVVDDELIVRESLTKWFREDGFRVDSAQDAAEALRKLQASKWNIMFVDIKMPGMDGIELLERVRKISKDIKVIIITAFASVESAVKALKEGAFDYITKPIDPDYLDHLVGKVLKEQELQKENLQLQERVNELSAANEIIGDAPSMKKLNELIATVAPTDTTVMIRGESGTGKELVAKAIHRLSPRKYFPLVVVNCGGMAESLLESELFGHERGAFTGAQYRRKGKIELADGGTLFLDEVGNISPKTQMDLLRVIETKQFTRVGGSAAIPSDFRIICATNRDLEKAVEDGSLREDLFYRLNVFTISLPPLRARQGDIPHLARHFLAKYSTALGKQIKGFSTEALQVLRAHDWPGNVRELENAIERAVVICNGPQIEVEYLPVHGNGKSKPPGKRITDIERTHIEQILSENGWNITKSAAVLDIDRVTLYNKIEKYGLKRDR
jgi:DNA-binding NtrC family response regulator